MLFNRVSPSLKRWSGAPRFPSHDFYLRAQMPLSLLSRSAGASEDWPISIGFVPS
jgi:hypothetical protein